MSSGRDIPRAAIYGWSTDPVAAKFFTTEGNERAKFVRVTALNPRAINCAAARDAKFWKMPLSM